MSNGNIIPTRGLGFATASFTAVENTPVSTLVANVAMIGGVVTGSGHSTLPNFVTGAFYNIATAAGSNVPVSGGTKLTDSRTFLSASFRGVSGTLIQAMNYLEARVSSADVDDLDIDGATDIGEAIVDADLFIVDNGANGTNRKTVASRIKTYVGAAAGAAHEPPDGRV